MGTPSLKSVLWKRGCPMAQMILFVVGFSAPSLRGQALPPPTTIPARLQTTLNSEKDLPGKLFTMKTTQDLPLDDRQRIRKGATITGHLLVAQSFKKGEHESQLALQLDSLDFSGQRISVTLGLRAMASFVAAEEAQMPTNDADMGPSNWTTQQIGGDVVYRGGGPVTTSWGETVGKPVNDGVMSRLLAPRNGPVLKGLHCAPSDKLHALGLFASTACGVYGFPNLMIERDGFDKPKGQISLVSPSRAIKIGAGSQFLLQVPPTDPMSGAKIKIDTVPDEYTPTNVSAREPVSLRGFHFEVNEETVRARVVVNYTYPDELVYQLEDDNHGPRPTVAQIPGLIYDPAAHAVVYTGDGKRTVCALVQERKGLFGKHLRIKSTGSCVVTAVDAMHAEDDGWSIHRYRALDTYFEAR